MASRAAAFAAHLDGLEFRDSAAREFETATDAVVTRPRTLDALPTQIPSLVHAARPHALRDPAALRRRERRGGFPAESPANAVAIARLLLTAGAAPDAAAETYGGGNAQTTMNLLVSSTHPDEAGVQAPLVDTLVDFGAAVDRLDDDGLPS